MFEIITAYAEGEAAQAGAAASNAGVQTLGMIEMFLPFVIIIVLMYFMMIRPQKKREKETREMQNALSVGDKIVTIGGIAGKVAKIKDEYVYIETSMPGTADKSYIKMERNSIREVIKKTENKKKDVEPEGLPDEEADEQITDGE